MPLSILLPLVIFGITGIVVLVRALRPTPPLLFLSAQQAAQVWDHRNHPANAQKVHLIPDNTCALVETASGPGLLWSFGVDPVTRLLNKHYVCSETQHGISIQTHNFTAPKINIPCPIPKLGRRGQAF